MGQTARFVKAKMRQCHERGVCTVPVSLQLAAAAQGWPCTHCSAQPWRPQGSPGRFQLSSLTSCNAAQGGWELQPRRKRLVKHFPLSLTVLPQGELFLPCR